VCFSKEGCACVLFDDLREILCGGFLFWCDDFDGLVDAVIDGMTDEDFVCIVFKIFVTDLCVLGGDQVSSL